MQMCINFEHLELITLDFMAKNMKFYILRAIFGLLRNIKNQLQISPLCIFTKSKSFLGTMYRIQKMFVSVFRSNGS